MARATMRAIYDIIKGYGLVTANVRIIRMYSNLSEDEISSTLYALYINGYLDRVAGTYTHNKDINTLYKPSKHFSDDRSL